MKQNQYLTSSRYFICVLGNKLKRLWQFSAESLTNLGQRGP